MHTQRQRGKEKDSRKTEDVRRGSKSRLCPDRGKREWSKQKDSRWKMKMNVVFKGSNQKTCNLFTWLWAAEHYLLVFYLPSEFDVMISLARTVSWVGELFS